jgi:hypothetical protein
MSDVVQYLVQLCIKMEEERLEDVKKKEKENGMVEESVEEEEDFE